MDTAEILALLSLKLLLLSVIGTKVLQVVSLTLKAKTYSPTLYPSYFARVTPEFWAILLVKVKSIFD